MTTTSPFHGVRDELRATLERRDYVEPTAVQSAVIGLDDRSQNLRISSQTGSGKTVAIGLALADDLLADEHQDRRGPLALLVAPTRELAAQVHRELSWLYAETPMALEVVTGGSNIRREQRALAARPQVLVGTPGRLLDHLRQDALDLGSVRHVVLDEADQMLDMGFRDELESLVAALPEERRSHLVSATFPEHVQRFANAFQGKAVTIQTGAPGRAHEDIEHVAYVVHATSRYDALVNELLMGGKRCLVFVRRRVDAAEVADKLQADGFEAVALSGDLPQNERDRCLEGFRQGRVRVLVATDVAARGIDVPDIELVVHLDLPTDPESYTHRSGRTGRAGQKGRSLALVPVRAERHARAIFARAKVKVRFAAPPTIDEVRAAVEAEARRQLDAQLAGDAPAPRFAEEARRLLAAHDAETLVARLLAASAPRLPTRPRQVNSALTPPRATRPRPQHGEAGAAVRFYVTWGRRRGASPKRVVALLCRRGGIAGGDIGHIDVGTQATVVEIDARVAADFASRAAAPDPRDPHVRIERFREQRADERHQRTSQPRASARRGLGSFEPHRPPTRGPAPGGAARHRPRDH